MTTKEKFFAFSGGIIFLLLYSLVGAICSLSYLFFTGEWSAVRAMTEQALVYYSPGFALLAPIYLSGMIYCWQAHSKQSPHFRWYHSHGGAYLLIGYSFLPIVFNAISIYVRMTGLEIVADVIFFLRYWSLILVPIAFFIVKKRMADRKMEKNQQPPITPVSIESAPGHQEGQSPTNGYACVQTT